MSYDLYFLRREPGQSWEEALQAQEEALPADEDAGGEAAVVDPAVRERLLGHARQVLGEVEVFENPAEGVWEIDHDPSGMQLSCHDGEWSLTVPYWTHGEESRKVIESMRQLALAVERETGLECYDPQLDRSLSEIPPTDTTGSVGIFDQVAEQFGFRR